MGAVAPVQLSPAVAIEAHGLKVFPLSAQDRPIQRAVAPSIILAVVVHVIDGKEARFCLSATAALAAKVADSHDAQVADFLKAIGAIVLTG